MAYMMQVLIECAVCGRRQTKWRRMNSKETRRVTHVYCPSCKEVRPHKEIGRD